MINTEVALTLQNADSSRGSLPRVPSYSYPRETCVVVVSEQRTGLSIQTHAKTLVRGLNATADVFSQMVLVSSVYVEV